MKERHVAIEILPRALWIIQGFTLFIGQSLTNRPPLLTNKLILLIFGSLFLIVGALYAIWAFRFLVKAMFSKELVVNGPYKYTRHPMYIAVYLLLVGIGLLFFSITWFIILIIFVPLWYFDCKAEESQMIDLHGEKYLDYKRKVGMFFPK